MPGRPCQRKGFWVVASVGTLLVAGLLSGCGQAATPAAATASTAAATTSPPAPTTTAAPPTTAPPPPTTAAAGNCDPAYPDVCLHQGIGDYDCAGGSGNGPNYVEGPLRVLPPDPFDLDGYDNDGVGCESG